MSAERENQFAEIVESLGPRWHVVYRPVVEDLLDLREMAGQRLAAYRENPWATGSRGQQVEHPALREYIALTVRILQLSEVLLLTPRARRRAGVDEPADDNPLAFLDD